MKLSTGLLTLSLAFGFGAATSACGQVTYVLQEYDGPPRAREQVSVLRIESEDPAQIVSLDGEPLGTQAFDSDVRFHIEMLPGRHTLAIKNPKAELQAAHTVAFVAEPGRVYRVLVADRPWHVTAPSANRPGMWSALIYEINPGDGRLLREVSLPPES